MSESLLKQAANQNHSKEELETWYAALSDDQRNQLWDELQQVFVESVKKFTELGEAAVRATYTIMEKLGKNADLLAAMNAVLDAALPPELQASGACLMTTDMRN